VSVCGTKVEVWRCFANDVNAIAVLRVFLVLRHMMFVTKMSQPEAYRETSLSNEVAVSNKKSEG